MLISLGTRVTNRAAWPARAGACRGRACVCGSNRDVHNPQSLGTTHLAPIIHVPAGRAAVRAGSTACTSQTPKQRPSPVGECPYLIRKYFPVSSQVGRDASAFICPPHSRESELSGLDGQLQGCPGTTSGNHVRPRTEAATHPPENRPHRRSRRRPRCSPRGQPSPAPAARPDRRPTSPRRLPAGTRRFQNRRHQPPPRRPHPTAAQPASTNSHNRASLPPKPSNG